MLDTLEMTKELDPPGKQTISLHNLHWLYLLTMGGIATWSYVVPLPRHHILTALLFAACNSMLPQEQPAIITRLIIYILWCQIFQQRIPLNDKLRYILKTTTLWIPETCQKFASTGLNWAYTTNSGVSLLFSISVPPLPSSPSYIT